MCLVSFVLWHLLICYDIRFMLFCRAAFRRCNRIQSPDSLMRKIAHAFRRLARKERRVFRYLSIVMPGLGGFEVTLTDLLMARSAPLTEEELWAVLAVSCECLENQMKRDKSTWASGPSLLITMDTLMLNRAGEVRFCPGSIAPDDPGSHAPPETATGEYDMTRASVEKMYIYSLGMSLFTAAEFERDEGLVLGDELESILLTMCEESPATRFSLNQVQETCAEHARKSNCLPFPDKVSAMIESLMGSTAVLDDIGSMDDLDVEDATLEQEIADALRMRTASMASVRTASSPSTHPKQFRGSAASIRSSPRTPIAMGLDVDVDDERDVARSHARKSPSPPTLTDRRPQLEEPQLEEVHSHQSFIGQLGGRKSEEELVVELPPSPPKSPTFPDLGSLPPPPPPPESEPPDSEPSDSEPPPIPPESPPPEVRVTTATLPVSVQQEREDPGEKPEVETVPVLFTRMANREEKSDSSMTDVGAAAAAHHERDRNARSSSSPPPKRETSAESPPPLHSTPAATRDDAASSWATFQADLAAEAAQARNSRRFVLPAVEEEEDAKNDWHDDDDGGDGDETVVTVTMTEEDEEVETSDYRLHDVSIASEPSPLKGAVLFQRDGTDTPTSSTMSTPKSAKKRRWGRKAKEPPHLGTVYGDEWPSVKRHESAKKLKTMFGPEFTKIHGDWKKPSVSFIGSGNVKLPSGRRLVSVVLLDGSQLSLAAEIKSTVGELLNLVMTHLSLKERFYFGLAVKKDDDEIWFMDPVKKLKKYAPLSWKSQGHSSETFQTYFRLKYYIDNLDIIKYTQTLHLFYLQMKRDLLDTRMYLHEDSALVLASYALQADYGDCDSSSDAAYFNETVYVRPQIVEKLTGTYVKDLLYKMHQQHRGLNQAQAQMEFVREMQRLSEYGLAFYRVKSGKDDSEENTVLGLGVRGLIVFETSVGRGDAKTPVRKYAWQQTRWVTFKEKRFTVIPDTKEKVKLHYYANHYRKSRYILRFCQELHKFQVLMAKRLASEKEFGEGKGAEREEDSDSDDDAKSYKSLLVTALSGSPAALRRTQVEQKNEASAEDSSAPAREVKLIKIIKSEGRGLGLLIVGGYMPKTGEDYGIYVKSVTPDGTAGVDGRIRPGDRILEVNGRSLDGLSHAQVVDLLKESPPLVELVVSRKVSLARASLEKEKEAMTSTPVSSTSSSNVTTVLTARLTRERGSLGISVIGGVNSRQPDGAVFVQSVAQGGPAEREGTIKQGDHLLRVNGSSLVGLDHVDVVQRLKDAGDEVEIEVERTGGKHESVGGEYDSLFSDGEVVRVSLTKDEYGLGFSLSGGADVGRPVSVKKVFDEGVASRDGRLRQGDVLVEVDGKRMQSLTHSEVVARLRAAPTPVRIVVVRPKTIVAPVTPQVMTKAHSFGSRSDSSVGKALRLTMSFAVASPPPPPPSSTFRSPSPDRVVSSRAESYVSDADAELVDVFGEQVLGKIFGVELKRGINGFGFSVTSGARSGVDESVLRGCFIRAVVADPALSDGRLQTGDQILSVNRISLKGVRHSEAVNMLRCSDGEQIQMSILRRTPQTIIVPAANDNVRYETPSPTMSPVSGDMPPLPPAPNPWYDKTLFIDLEKDNQGFGFSLYTMPNWGTNESGQTFDCVYVKRIDALSSAGRDGRLRVNDRLLEVDGEVVEGKAYYQVVNTLRRTRGRVVLKVARQPKFSEVYEPEEVEVERVDAPSAARVLMPMKGRRPTESPAKMRRNVAVREPTDFVRPEINVVSVDDVDGKRPPTPDASSFGPSAGILPLRDGRVVYRVDRLDVVCEKIKNHVNADDTAETFSSLRGERSPASTSVGRMPQNLHKNRFPNLLPLDLTRVKLSVAPGHSDYINASHVKLVIGSRPHRYICTQAPLKSTVDDFWQMVWEQKSSVIAMITKLVENKKEKCVSYWPKKVGSTMRVARKTLEITLASQHTFDHHVTRMIKIRRFQDEKSTRNIVHLQYTDWPDRGTPTDPSTMIEFVSTARKVSSGFGSDPTVIHCGAGMGRTGVYLVIDYVLGAVEQDAMADIDGTIQSLRESRPNLVQTKDQFLFCHKAYLNIVQSLGPKDDDGKEEEVMTV